MNLYSWIRNHEPKAYLDKRNQMDCGFFANAPSIAIPEVKGTFKEHDLHRTVWQKTCHTNAKKTYKI